jgi:hypothetical protein
MAWAVGHWLGVLSLKNLGQKQSRPGLTAKGGSAEVLQGRDAVASLLYHPSRPVQNCSA